MTKTYSLRKCRNVFKDAVIRHKALSKHLSSDLMSQFERQLDALDLAIQNKDTETANLKVFEVQQFLIEHGKKTTFEHIREFTVAIILALIIAAVVRQMWFELYEIPSGSMRPTFRESDRVLVFKDTFCINKLFETDHFYFEPKYVERGSITVLTGDKLDLPDVDTVYFGLFPGKRRYVKRCVAKDGDTIYFYGGKIFGIDKNGSPLTMLQESPVFAPLEYIPFISFEGKFDQDTRERAFTLKHMNIPMGKVEQARSGTLTGKAIGSNKAFGEHWGLGNFAMSRLIEPKDLPSSAKILGYQNDAAVLYLEVKHSPRFPTKADIDSDGYPALVSTSISWIPLDATACQTLKESLYTARFYVRKGTAFRYTPEGPDLKGRGVLLDKSIPDGCYEIIDGAALEIGWGSITHLLPPTHPLYPHTPKLLKTLYNCGIDFSNSTNNPQKYNYFPSRYTYYRDGSLYTLGKPLFTKDAPTLAHFEELETTRKQQQNGYTAFLDKGSPVKDGELDVDFIKANGLPIAEGHYLLLGDNHAMSNDSRFFGAVPQKNLQGSPALIFWPPGERWGRPPQPSLPWFRVSNVVVVSAALAFGWLSMTLYNRRTSHKTYERTRKRRLTKKL
ncbi:MAG: signal peptidase I [Chlamydiales bacterium]|nr:signal peptidase I [Chlamydiales bacterium]